MLFNIITGKGVPKRNQEDIVYLCVPLKQLMCERFQWCFTDKIRNWNTRKKNLIKKEHVSFAYQHLKKYGSTLEFA